VEPKMSWTLIITVAIEIVKNVNKFLPDIVEWWKKRNDSDYMKRRDRIRRKRDKEWEKVLKAEGDEQEKLLQKYLDRYIRNR
jgi:hypothetical protein